MIGKIKLIPPFPKYFDAYTSFIQIKFWGLKYIIGILS